MRIRSIKPEFWRSPDITCLSVEDRLLFIGLWSYVDDNGVGVDAVPRITADLFADDLACDPLDTLARVTGGLQRLAEAGRIIRYVSDGRGYLAIDNWGKHQRIDKPGKARYPAPDRAFSGIPEVVATLSRVTREISAPGSEEQGNRGAEEQGTRGSVEVTTQVSTEGSPQGVHGLTLTDSLFSPQEYVHRLGGDWEAIRQEYIVQLGEEPTAEHMRRLVDTVALRAKGGPKNLTGLVIASIRKDRSEWLRELRRAA